jgi:hypothetical protein
MANILISLNCYFFKYVNNLQPNIQLKSELLYFYTEILYIFLYHSEHVLKSI